MDMTRQLLDLPDGRTLCFAEWGDPEGFPVVALHGTPGNRLNRHPDSEQYVRAGARIITYDRAGYGASTRRPGRSVVDSVEDVAALVDHLGIGRFSVTGGSGGGPHSLAVAARLGDRVVRARCAVGIAPYRAAGLDFFAGMTEMNVTEFRWALEGEDVLVPNIEREHAGFVARVAAEPATMLGDYEVDAVDVAVMARDDMATMLREFGAELGRGGYWGWSTTTWRSPARGASTCPRSPSPWRSGTAPRTPWCLLRTVTGWPRRCPVLPPSSSRARATWGTPTTCSFSPGGW